MPKNIHPIATATIEGLYITSQGSSFTTSLVETLEIDEYGIKGDARRNAPGGYTPYSQVGVRFPAFPPSRLIIARREVSIMDITSAEQIGDALGMPEDMDLGPLGPDRNTAVSRILGTNILLRMHVPGPELHQIPNATDFGPTGDNGLLTGAALLITSYNNPCMRPFRRAVELLPDVVSPGRQFDYMERAQAYRGSVATPSACGVLAVGQQVDFFPRPTAYQI